MPNWSTTTKHEPSSINNGRQYELRDRVSIEQLNNMTENSFYAMEASSVAKEKAEEALKFAQGSGTTVYENGSPVAEFNADKKVNTVTLEKNYYNKQEVDDILASGSVDVDLSDYYKKSETYSKKEVDDKLANLELDIDFSDYYTKTETESLLIKKADKSELNNYLPTKTKYGASLDLSINTTDYKVTAQIKDQNGNNLGDAKTIDLPLESVVVSGRYDNATKKVVLTLQNNTEISFSVADLVSGLQSQITLSNKLASDLVSDTNQTNKFVTAEEKSTWNNKVDVSVDNLTNYYKKAETYTKTETANLLNSALSTKADKTELESLATKEELNSYAKKDEVVTEDDLKDYATETQLNTGLSNLNNELVERINNKADASELEELETSINNVSNNLTGVTNKYVTDAVVSTDGKTLTITKKEGNQLKQVYFEGGGTEVKQLVCEHTFGAGRSFQCSDLDLEADGGVYDMVFSFPKASSANNPYFRFNNISSSSGYVYSNYSSQNGNNMTGGTQQISDKALLGIYSSGQVSTTIMTVVLSNNIPMWSGMYTTYYNSILHSVFYGYTGAGNVTSMQIICPNEIPAGTNVKIYRRIK